MQLELTPLGPRVPQRDCRSSLFSFMVLFIGLVSFGLTLLVISRCAEVLWPWNQ